MRIEKNDIAWGLGTIAAIVVLFLVTYFAIVAVSDEQQGRRPDPTITVTLTPSPAPRSPSRQSRSRPRRSPSRRSARCPVPCHGLHRRRHAVPCRSRSGCRRRLLARCCAASPVAAATP